MTLSQDILECAKKGPESLEETERAMLLQAAEKLTAALENPLEKFTRLFFVGIVFLTALPDARSPYTISSWKYS